MIKDHISYYDEHRVPTSLRDIPIRPDCENRIEYLFYAVNLSKNFDDLTEQLSRIIDVPFVEIDRQESFIVYRVCSGKTMYLKVKVKLPESVLATQTDFSSED